MKTRTLLFIFILLSAVFVLFAGGSKKEELNGTWINPDYDKTWKDGKIIIKPGGTYDEYNMSYSDSPSLKWGYTITDKWTDFDGNIFYKFIVKSIYKEEVVRTSTWYYLAKIDKTGNVYEYNDSVVDFPSEIDPNHGNYAIHYRQ